MRRITACVVLVNALLVLAGCESRSSAFDRPAGPADALPGTFDTGFRDSRLVDRWQEADVYLAVPESGSGICLVVVALSPPAGSEPGASACADAPPLELGLKDVGTFRYDMTDPDDDDGWQSIGSGVFARH